ncbi:MAG: hypothetical protein ACR2QY_04570 [Akkermansiaceae bacterium]|jgi:hypothetical protein
MIQIDCSSSSFWEGLSTLGICDYEVRFPTSATRGTIDLSSGHISDEEFLVPEAGLSFRRARRGMVYASVKSAVLYFISENRELALILEPKLASSRRQLYFITGAFWMGNVLEDFKPASLKTPSLCPCCRDAADFRVSSMAQNPLTIMLARTINKRIAVTISMSSRGGNSTISHSPMNLLKKGSYLVSEGQSCSMEVDINHLYAFRLVQEDFDGENHERLLLFDSHGNNFCDISVKSSDVGDLWRTVLNCEKSGYELAGHDDHKK